MKRQPKRTTPAELELIERFRVEVLKKRPVLCLPGQRSATVDPHHVIPKRVLRNDHGLSKLEPEEFWAVLWDPDNGVPVERPLHDLFTTGARRIDIDDLRPENIAFAERHGLERRLAVESPTWAARAGWSLLSAGLFRGQR